MLSFFSSETIEQMHGNGVVNRAQFQREEERAIQRILTAQPQLQRCQGYKCKQCGFGKGLQPVSQEGTSSTSAARQDVSIADADTEPPYASPNPDAKVGFTDLPRELLLSVCDQLDDEVLVLAAKAWNGFGRVMRQYNIIHVREMQCFTLKTGFNKAALGVGVHIEGKEIQSKFDLISIDAVFDLDVSRSVQGLDFEYWLP